MNDYLLMSRVLQYLASHARDRPSLEQLAGVAGLSPGHFQRKFCAWVGISPKSYLQYLALENARRLLEEGSSVLDAALDTGLSGPGRLHDLCVTLEAATPGEVKTGGADLPVTYGFGPTPFGDCLLANSPRGICYLAFIGADGHERAVADLAAAWPGARLSHRQKGAMADIRRVFSPAGPEAGPLRAYVKGTRFQLRVWRALLQIPTGGLVSYGELAARIKRPGAARAVGAAVGANTLAYLIPCHRVIRSNGIMTGYRWGNERKQAMIVNEAARRAAAGVR
jgi:AraC family transcriptional regulator of adaptative response/methylated-DNA-[protein]-cysteine methyltransferase